MLNYWPSFSQISFFIETSAVFRFRTSQVLFPCPPPPAWPAGAQLNCATLYSSSYSEPEKLKAVPQCCCGKRGQKPLHLRLMKVTYELWINVEYTVPLPTEVITVGIYGISGHLLSNYDVVRPKDLFRKTKVRQCLTYWLELVSSLDTSIK